MPLQAQHKSNKHKEDEWKTDGNVNIDSTSEFLGTVDVSPIIIKTNDIERMRITGGGSIGIGTPAPQYPFDVQVSTRIKKLTISEGLTVSNLHFCRGLSCSTDTIHTTGNRDLLLRSFNTLGLS